MKMKWQWCPGGDNGEQRLGCDLLTLQILRSKFTMEILPIAR